MNAKALTLTAVICVSLSAFSCAPSAQKSGSQTDAEQDLRITLGGFQEGHPDEGTVEGVCTPDLTRTMLDCDIYNGLVGRAVTELKLVITWSPYKEGDKRFYSQRVSIEPLKTEHVSIRLGLQLPPDDPPFMRRGRRVGPRLQHWGWLIASAKGHRIP